MKIDYLLIDVMNDLFNSYVVIDDIIIRNVIVIEWSHVCIFRVSLIIWNGLNRYLIKGNIFMG